MFKEIRRSDRKLDKEDIDQLLEKSGYGTLSMIGTNGYPYGIPISYVLVDGNVYFHCAAGVGSKVENIAANPKVCFTVVDHVETLPEQFSTRYESAVVYGRAAICEEPIKTKALECLIGKYSKGFELKGSKYIQAMADKTAVYEITIDHVSGKGRKV